MLARSSDVNVRENIKIIHLQFYYHRCFAAHIENIYIETTMTYQICEAILLCGCSCNPPLKIQDGEGEGGRNSWYYGSGQGPLCNL